MRKGTIERQALGIQGLDNLIEGGIPLNSSILVCGVPGAGKTTFVLQAAMSVIGEGRRVAYITSITEPLSMVLKYGSTYSFFDADGFIAGTEFYNVGEKLRKLGDLSGTLDAIISDISGKNVRLVIIDPVTVLRDYADPITYRQILDDLISKLRLLDVIIIFTGEAGSTDYGRMTESYLVDGIIMITNVLEGNIRQRYLEIVKLRGTRHSNNLHSLVIDDAGLKVQMVSL